VSQKIKTVAEILQLHFSLDVKESNSMVTQKTYKNWCRNLTQLHEQYLHNNTQQHSDTKKQKIFKTADTAETSLSL